MQVVIFLILLSNVRCNSQTIASKEIENSYKFISILRQKDYNTAGTMVRMTQRDSITLKTYFNMAHRLLNKYGLPPKESAKLTSEKELGFNRINIEYDLLNQNKKNSSDELSVAKLQVVYLEGEFNNKIALFLWLRSIKIR